MANGGDAKGARHNRHMAGFAAFFQNHAAHFAAVIVQQFRWPHVARNNDGIVWKIRARSSSDRSREMAQHAVRQIIQIMHPLAQIRIRRAHHAGPIVILHALNRSLSGEPGLHRLFQSAKPTFVMSKHADGFENIH